MAWQVAGPPDTLTGTGDTMTVEVSDLTHYVFLSHALPSGNFRQTLRLNSDAGNNYAHRDSTDGAADATKVSRPQIEMGAGDEATTSFIISYWFNLSGEEKLGLDWEVRSNTAGAANAPTRKEQVAKWVNTSDPIDEFNIINDQGGDFATDSNLSALGTD